VVKSDSLHYLTKKGKLKAPLIPPPLKNHGNPTISLGKFTQWLAEKAEAKGVQIFPGFPAQAALMEGNQVVGVQTGDKGISKEGTRKDNFEAGILLKAKVTVLGEGPRGTLTKQLTEKLKLDEGCNPQVYATGVKELWEVPEGRVKPGEVYNTMGYPLKSETFGGGFVYTLDNNKIALGFVTGLDYKDPYTSPHRNFNAWKAHPYIAGLLKDGKCLSYGAKAIPEGGYFAQPKYYMDGCMLIGDSAGFLNTMALKGVHLAMKSGMLAAEAILQALIKENYSEASLKTYKDLVEKSWIKKELWKVRNFHQGFEKGMLAGMIHTGLQIMTGGRGVKNRYPAKASHEYMQTLKTYHGNGATADTAPEFKPDGKLTFDRVTDIYVSGTTHEEDQPSHLKVADFDLCNTKCKEEFGNPCQHFCPAQVYEMVDKEDGKGKQLHLNPANCVHCKTCDIADPYQIITWVPPEGGGGPNYNGL
jgi:electron-transferring-flavoprotein dehydrogenase